MSNLGRRIKELRNVKRLSQTELGVLCNTTSAAISRYENERRIPRSDILAKIAKALDTSVDYLLEQETELLKEEDNVRIKSALQVIGMAQKQNEITPNQAKALEKITLEVFGDIKP